MAVLLDRAAGAPITWGVCEVPGWGFQMSRSRVLSEMASVGLRATELGPEGFLPASPDRASRALAHHGLRAVGRFLPVVLHEPALLDGELRKVAAASDTLAACGGDVLVLAAAIAADGYEVSAELNERGWSALARGIERAEAIASKRGLVAALHPHVGTAVERRDHVRRALDGSAVRLCLDTGHLMVGGTDPAQLAREVPDRIAHVHLKDVDAELAERVRAGHLSYRDAVADGLYQPLGDGDADIAGIVQDLESAGYRGWFVLEQDMVLDAAPKPGGGPVEAAARSLGFLATVAARAEDGVMFVPEGRRGTPQGAATREARGGMG